MLVISSILLFLTSIHPFSFVIHCWKKKNKKAAIGMLLLILASICIPIIVIVYRN